MLVTDDHVVIARAYLLADDSLDEALDKVEQPNEQGFLMLLSTAFVATVRRRVRPGSPRADVVRFVASLRSQMGSQGTAIDPSRAEQLIHAVLTDYGLTDLDDETRLLQFDLLPPIIREAGLEASNVDEFLSAVRREVENVQVG